MGRLQGRGTILMPISKPGNQVAEREVDFKAPKNDPFEGPGRSILRHQKKSPFEGPGF